MLQRREVGREEKHLKAGMLTDGPREGAVIEEPQLEGDQNLDLREQYGTLTQLCREFQKERGKLPVLDYLAEEGAPELIKIYGLDKFIAVLRAVVEEKNVPATMYEVIKRLEPDRRQRFELYDRMDLETDTLVAELASEEDVQKSPLVERLLQKPPIFSKEKQSRLRHANIRDYRLLDSSDETENISSRVGRIVKSVASKARRISPAVPSEGEMWAIPSKRERWEIKRTETPAVDKLRTGEIEMTELADELGQYKGDILKMIAARSTLVHRIQQEANSAFKDFYKTLEKRKLEIEQAAMAELRDKSREMSSQFNSSLELSGDKTSTIVSVFIRELGSLQIEIEKNMREKVDSIEAMLDYLKTKSVATIGLDRK